MSDTLPLDLNANPLVIGRHVGGIADSFNGHIDEFRISHVQRSGDLERRNGVAAEAERRATCLKDGERHRSGTNPPLAWRSAAFLSGIAIGYVHGLTGRRHGRILIHAAAILGISDQSTGSARSHTLKAPAPRVSRARRPI